MRNACARPASRFANRKRSGGTNAGETRGKKKGGRDARKTCPAEQWSGRRTVQMEGREPPFPSAYAPLDAGRRRLGGKRGLHRFTRADAVHETAEGRPAFDVDRKMRQP